MRAEGAVPATIAVVDGAARVGLDDAALEALALGGGFAKAGVRDLAPVIARRRLGRHDRRLDGPPRRARRASAVFATGGLGGVHRDARRRWDESADLHDARAHAASPSCAPGVKSILDVARRSSASRRSTSPCSGYRTDRFPGFYLSDSGYPVPWRVDSPERGRRRDARAGRGRARRPRDRRRQPAAGGRAGRSGAARPRAGRGARGGGAPRASRGRAITPFLLDRLHRETGGATLEANVALVRRNAALAARIAARRGRRWPAGSGPRSSSSAT